MADTQKLKQDLWKRMADSPFIMVELTDGSGSEPLTAQLDKGEVDTLWFFVGCDNRLVKGGGAMAHYVSKGHDFFACLNGNVSLNNDRSMIDKLWSKQAESWFPGGKEDPSLAVLQFNISGAELWETDVSVTGKLKMIFGGKIEEGEAGSHAKVTSTAV
jgi:general stress protein 26